MSARALHARQGAAAQTIHSLSESWHALGFLAAADPGPQYLPVEGTPQDDVLTGTAGDDVVNALAGNDRISVQQGGTDTVDAGDGNDGIYVGAIMTSATAVDGGPGLDTLALQGNYPALVLGAGVVNVEVLFTAPGNDTRFGDNAGNSYDYDITIVDANVAAGARLTVIGGYLRTGEDLVFDGSAELDGHFRVFAGRGLNNLTGGAGSDGFYFGADGNWSATSRVDGGAGVDTIAFRGNYFDATAVTMVDASFANIEVMTFLSGHTNEYGGFIDTDGFNYDVTLADGNIAAGQRLDVIATTLRENEGLRFIAQAETNGSVRVLGGAGEDILRTGAGADILAGGKGFDVLDGGAGADTYLFTSVEDAPKDSVLADKVDLRTGDGDRIDLSMIDAIAGTSANDAFTFIGEAELSNVAGQLRAYRPSPSIANSWTIFADVDGDGEADLWISALSDVPITAADFVL
jgi:Ca2+-binding RTX toxin-like protein